jgi:hypothetical protein
MNMGIKPSSGDDTALASNHIRASPYNHRWVDSFHHVRIPRFSNAHDDTILDADICFDDARPIHYKSINNDQIERFRIWTAAGLTHAFS